MGLFTKLDTTLNRKILHRLISPEIIVILYIIALSLLVQTIYIDLKNDINQLGYIGSNYTQSDKTTNEDLLAGSIVCSTIGILLFFIHVWLQPEREPIKNLSITLVLLGLNLIFISYFTMIKSYIIPGTTSSSIMYPSYKAINIYEIGDTPNVLQAGIAMIWTGISLLFIFSLLPPQIKKEIVDPIISAEQTLLSKI